MTWTRSRLALLALLSVFLALPVSGESIGGRAPRDAIRGSGAPRLMVWAANASTVLSTNNCLLSAGAISTLQNCASIPHIWSATAIPFSGGPFYLGRLTCFMGTLAGADTDDHFAVKVQQILTDSGGTVTSSYLGSAAVATEQESYNGGQWSRDINAWTAAAGSLELRLGGYTDTGTGMDTRAVCSLEVW